MYITYAEDDRIVVSEKRLTKKDVEKLEKQGICFFEEYDDIEYEKHSDIVLIDTRVVVTSDDM